MKFILGPVSDRLNASPRLQRLVRRIHAAGPRAVGEAIAQVLEDAGVGPEGLDALEQHGWPELEPQTVAKVGARDFAPAQPLRLVPKVPGK